MVPRLAFSSDDWSATRAMARVWAIVCGWDDPEDPEGSSMDAVAARFGWDETAVARLRRLHTAFELATQYCQRTTAAPIEEKNADE